MLDPSLLENLDGMWPDDLQAYATRLMNTEVAPEDEATRNALATYAEVKAQAMEKRAAGSITDAMRREIRCDGIYESLPDYAKW